MCNFAVTAKRIYFQHIMKYDITINGTIGWETTSDYISYQLQKMKGKRVDVRICSLGGYVTDGIDIYQLFRDHGDVHCHFVGMSASAATFLAMGAKSVDMVKNSLILIHNASIGQFTWGSYNKEQLDELIKSLGKDREQLATIDSLIASVYADRCGKSIEEVEEKMKVAAWITAADAKSFGLVDAIRDEVEDDEKNVQNIVNCLSPSNDKLKELGLPPLPDQEEENPTNSETLLQMVARKLGLSKQVVNQEPTAATENAMLKIFKTVAAILAVEGFALNKEGNIELTQDQLKQIDDAAKKSADDIKALKDKVKELTDAAGKDAGKGAEDKTKEVEDLQEQIKDLQKKNKDLTDQVEALKKKPGDESHEAPASEENEVTGADFAKNFLD